jgi:rod shape-determining protein MreD
MALVLVFFKFSLGSLFSLPLVFFDPLLALVLIYTFFHSMDVKYFIGYALFCGLLSDCFSLMGFGSYLCSYALCAWGTSLATRFIYRQNWIFVFPLVFIFSFLNSHFLFLLSRFFPGSVTFPYSGLFFLRALIESIGTTCVAYPLYLFSKRWLSELIG